MRCSYYSLVCSSCWDRIFGRTLNLFSQKLIENSQLAWRFHQNFLVFSRIAPKFYVLLCVLSHNDAEYTIKATRTSNLYILIFEKKWFLTVDQAIWGTEVHRSKSVLWMSTKFFLESTISKFYNEIWRSATIIQYWLEIQGFLFKMSSIKVSLYKMTFQKVKFSL